MKRLRVESVLCARVSTARCHAMCHLALINGLFWIISFSFVVVFFLFWFLVQQKQDRIKLSQKWFVTVKAPTKEVQRENQNIKLYVFEYLFTNVPDILSTRTLITPSAFWALFLHSDQIHLCFMGQPNTIKDFNKLQCTTNKKNAEQLWYDGCSLHFALSFGDLVAPISIKN